MHVEAISLTRSQRDAAKRIRGFLQNPALDAFVLTGYAGTGKTHLIRWLCEELDRSRWTPVPLAPTGRAARMLTARSGWPAATVHSAIYNLHRVEEPEEGDAVHGIRLRFGLRANDLAAPCFVVDEASMVTDHFQDSDTLRFGSGHLLSDLLEFAGRGPMRFKMLFVGDPAQLPPVGSSFSPALSADYLTSEKGLEVDGFLSTDVVRQREDSAVLENATRIRQSLESDRFAELDVVPAPGEVTEIPVPEVVDRYLGVVRERGFACATLLVGGNRGALEYNLAVRRELWGEPECPVRRGDLLLVCHNNLKTGLMNGDLVRVADAAPRAETVVVPLRGRGQVELRFRDLILRYRNAAGEVSERPCKGLDNLLFSLVRGLSSEEQAGLYVHFRQRHPGLTPRDPEFPTVLRDDPYFQALQVKFGYALTCHKAQGGEWDEVFVHFDLGRGQRNADFFRWAYTAITRARIRLYTVNAPHFNAVTGVRVQDADLPQEPVPPAVLGAPLESVSQDAPPGVEELLSRFGFPPAREHLRSLFRAIQGRTGSGGLQILDVLHGQYHERYRFGLEDEVVQFQVYYDGADRFTRVVPVGRQRQSAALDRVRAVISAAMQIANMHGELEAADHDRSAWPQALLELTARFEAALAARGISVVRREAMSWRERLGFRRGTETAEFDFLYNQRGQWTNVQAVRRKDRSTALSSELAEVFRGLG